MSSHFEIDCPCGNRVRIETLSSSQPTVCSSCGAEFLLEQEETLIPMDEDWDGSCDSLVRMECVCGTAKMLKTHELGDTYRCDSCGVEMPVIKPGADFDWKSTMQIIQCVCGAETAIEEDALKGSFHCESCGVEFPLLHSGEVSGGHSNLLEEVAAPPRRTEIPDPVLKCPSCGGQGEVARRGEDQSDKMLFCPFCKTVVDLPEAWGKTREKITERPNERIVERVTEWEGAEPSMDSLKDLSGDFTVTRSLDDSFEFNGETMHSKEEFEKKIREMLPEDMARSVLSNLDSASQADFPSSGRRNRNQVYEYSSLKVDNMEAPVERDESPLDEKVLSKIQNFFKSKRSS